MCHQTNRFDLFQNNFDSRLNRQFFSWSSEEANVHLKHWNRNIWSTGSIGNTTPVHLLCNYKNELVSLESYVWTWAQRRWLSLRRSRLRSFTLLCFRKLSQKCLLFNWRSDIYFGISSKKANVRYFNNLR